jgi:glycosyltransferase involved in cell wall biosynthesis
MRIAQVAPLYESCPPQLYGGTERVVSYLTEELVRQGHEVTLFASGDSRTDATLRASCDRALRLCPECMDPLPYHLVMLNHVARCAHMFDIIHFHIDQLHFPLFAPLWDKTLTTTHGRLDLPDLPVLFREFPMMPLASISDAQRAPLGSANWYRTVHHGLPADLCTLGRGNGGYVAFIGRISPEKGVDRAVAIARRVGIPLKIAAKVDKVDRAYYDAEIKPLIKGPGVEFIGEIGEREKRQFLGQAMALLFPIDWPEPFGLATIEAIANGTPVVAYSRGAVPEVIDHGVTGFIVDSIAEAVAALPQAVTLDRRAIRHRFEERFTVERMARDYVDVYNEVLHRSSVSPVVVNDIVNDTAAERRDAA